MRRFDDMSQEFSLQKLVEDIYGQRYINPENRIEQLLDTVGDGSGTTEMINAVADYLCVPPTGWIYVLARMNVYVEDGTNEKFSASKYGASAALTNGIVLTVDNVGGTIINLTPNPIKKIGHWELGAGVDMVWTDFPAGSSDFAGIRWTFTRGGGPIFLRGDEGEFLKFRVQDDLGAGGAALVSHLAQVQGFRYKS